MGPTHQHFSPSATAKGHGKGVPARNGRDKFLPPPCGSDRLYANTELARRAEGRCGSVLERNYAHFARSEIRVDHLKTWWTGGKLPFRFSVSQLARVTLMLEFCLDVVGGVMIPPADPVRSRRGWRELSVAAVLEEDASSGTCWACRSF